MISSSLMVVYGSVFGFIFQQQIQDSITTIYNSFINNFFNCIEIDKEYDPKCTFAIYDSLNDMNITRSSYKVHDSLSSPHYIINNGIYMINYTTFIKITNDKIFLMSIKPSKMITLREFFDNIYKKYSSSESIITFYVSDKNGWGKANIKRPRNIVKITDCMIYVLDDVDNFMKSEELYLNEGKPYRSGYLLKGEPGTGKSTLIEIISQKYDMTIYMLSICSIDMDDSSLLRTTSTIPHKSLIVIEEIDHQINSINNCNNKNYVTIGGLQTAIDGCQRLPYNSILIVTCNSDKFLENNKALVRDGIIDVEKELTEKL